MALNVQIVKPTQTAPVSYEEVGDTSMTMFKFEDGPKTLADIQKALTALVKEQYVVDYKNRKYAVNVKFNELVRNNGWMYSREFMTYAELKTNLEAYYEYIEHEEEEEEYQNYQTLEAEFFQLFVVKN